MLGILPRAQAWRYLDMIVVEKKLFVSRCPKLRALNCLFVRSDQVSRNFRTKTEDIKEAAAAWLCLLRSTYKSTKKNCRRFFFYSLASWHATVWHEIQTALSVCKHTFLQWKVISRFEWNFWQARDVSFRRSDSGQRKYESTIIHVMYALVRTWGSICLY